MYHLRTGDFLEVDACPTITETTKPITIGFEFTGAAQDPFNDERIGLKERPPLTGNFGMNWSAALENGGPMAANGEKLMAVETDERRRHLGV